MGAKVSKRRTQTHSKINRRSIARLRRRLAIFQSAVITVAAVIEQVEAFINDDIPAIARDTLRAMGLDWYDDDPLTIAGFTAVVSRMSGVDFHDLGDVEQVKRDVMAHAFDVVEEQTGFRPTSLDPAVLRQQLADFVVSQCAAPVAIMPGAVFVEQLRKVVKDAARDEEYDSAPRGWSAHLARWNHREAQRAYGQTHVQIWEGGPLVWKIPVFARPHYVKGERAIRQAWHDNCKQWRKMQREDEPAHVGGYYLINYNPSGDYKTLAEYKRAGVRSKLGWKPVRNGST